MKKIFYLILPCLLLALSGCEKAVLDEEPEEPVEGSVTLQLHISSDGQAPFHGGEATDNNLTDLRNLCQWLSLGIFQDGKRVKSIHQESSEATFGKFSVSLPEGTYEYVVVAYNSTGKATLTSPEKITFTDNKCTDTFYAHGTLNLSATETRTVSLRRAVAMVRFTVKDAIPEEVSQMKFFYTGGSSTFNAVSGYGCVNSRQTQMFDVGDGQREPGASFDLYTLPHTEDDLLKITVTALDRQGSEVMSQVIEDVPVRRNTITQLGGTLFGGSDEEAGDLTFIIDADGQWSGQIDHSY